MRFVKISLVDCLSGLQVRSAITLIKQLWKLFAKFVPEIIVR